jgi:homoserine O-acetyltransferase
LTAATDVEDGWYTRPPTKGLVAFIRVYCSLVFCSDFYRDTEYAKLGRSSSEDTMRFFEGFFRQRDANDLLAGLPTWRHADISANDRYKGDLGAALGAITARAIVMPSTTDFLFAAADSETVEFVDAAVRELLAA